MLNATNKDILRRRKIGRSVALWVMLLLIGGCSVQENKESTAAGDFLEIDALPILGNSEIVEGRLIWNLIEFQSFYGMEDSLVNIALDTIEYYLELNKGNSELEGSIEEYLFLKQMDLLYSPCQFLIINNQKRRVYFSEEDIGRIDDTDWFNKNKRERMHTFLKMRIREIKDGIYHCEEILSISQRVLTREEE